MLGLLSLHGARVGHVHFMLFVSNSFALGSQRERSFQWNMGFKEFYTLINQHFAKKKCLLCETLSL